MPRFWLYGLALVAVGCGIDTEGNLDPSLVAGKGGSPLAGQGGGGSAGSTQGGFPSMGGAGTNQGGAGVSGAGMNQGGAGVNQGGAGMNQGGAGTGQGGAGMNQGGAGTGQGGAGVNQDGAGMNQGGAGDGGAGAPQAGAGAGGAGMGGAGMSGAGMSGAGVGGAGASGAGVGGAGMGGAGEGGAGMGGTPFTGSSLVFSPPKDAFAPAGRVLMAIASEDGTASYGANVGADDFTIEFWMRGSAQDNPVATPIDCQKIDDEPWFYGRFLFDRNNANQGHLWGLTVSPEHGLMVGLRGASKYDRFALCSETNLLDALWHHVAVTRSVADGNVQIFVDGKLITAATGPAGDISYGPGTTSNLGNFLSVGAEKQNQLVSGSYLPSFVGYLDELRFSKGIRYSSNFPKPTAPPTVDASTLALYHFDEGTGSITSDAVNPSPATDGQLLPTDSSNPPPDWSSQIPF